MSGATGVRRPRATAPRRARRASGTVARVRDAVRAQMADGLARGVFPGAVAAVVQKGRWLVHRAFGEAQVVPWRRPMTVGTIFDLASLTKPVATTTAILHLWEQRAITLDARVASYLPRFAACGKKDVTVRQLLTHTSGLPAWEMLYLPGHSRGDAQRATACRSIEEAVARICATPAGAVPGARVEYSDLGFIVLGHLVERVSGQSLDVYALRRLFGPPGMTRTRFVPPRSWWPRCAATEVGNGYERAKAAEQGIGRRFPWRSRLLRGQVHDGNAWHLGRGVAGHAGLFGTAADIARFAMAMLRGGSIARARILHSDAVAEATRIHASGPGDGPRGLGWAMKGCPFLGARASTAAYGHTGFTGTSLLVDPPRDLVIVLLTNRVHPQADDTTISAFRPAFHDAVIEALDG